jgi:hypothetical protein
MGEIRFLNKPLSQEELQVIADERFGDMVKAVVDIDQSLVGIGGELHADIEAAMIDRGSLQKNLWGINLYPTMTYPEKVEFDSMINIRPSQGNRSRGVEDVALQQKILDVVKKFIPA